MATESRSRGLAFNAIQELAAEVEVGQDHRSVCPQCGGGSTGERSLSIRRTSKVQASFICYRANCDLGHGTVMILKDGNKVVKGNHKNVSTSRQKVNIATLPLWRTMANMLCTKYGLDYETLVYGNVRATRDGRAAFTIFGPKRQRRGYVIRKYKDHYRGNKKYATIPKALNYFSRDDQIGLSWYYAGRAKKKTGDTLVLVEDCVSAMRLCKKVDACALLGTMFEPKRQKEVKAQRYKTVYLCLDADARKKATVMKRNTAAYLPNLKIRYLDKDIKDMTEDEFNEFLEGL